MIIKILFYLPSVLISVLSQLLPFNKEKYKPSSATEREMSQYMRNKVRKADYYAKKIITQ